MAKRKKIEYSLEFLELRKIYPKRPGNPWPKALKAYSARIKQGYATTRSWLVWYVTLRSVMQRGKPALSSSYRRQHSLAPMNGGRMNMSYQNPVFRISLKAWHANNRSKQKQNFFTSSQKWAKKCTNGARALIANGQSGIRDNSVPNTICSIKTNKNAGIVDFKIYQLVTDIFVRVFLSLFKQRFNMIAKHNIHHLTIQLL